ncbi:hypothetical protein FPQ18DRAFT_31315 [Pyronema domesticum]|uniref:Similar to Lysine-specific histone demethylase 1 acc. no. Q9Y802 n=1 Tax=Pyronema omphalodes (strain CBS 100304) TaxID=1076935 RepID=U4LPG5_PYROM|nr:hypothetical protein FPQ18DRAFT_31315 [Pyronema domesticum]CCX33820.1 Similar to Lysine-specific histone demethylase 1; acc. no. Q9Y802 [Pyronema omphalodes CBS 100304]
MLQPTRHKIAIIGTGISGLSAAWALNKTKQYEVHLYEASDRLGGHTNTVAFPHKGREVMVDAGFAVLNDATYPNFLSLLDHLGIKTEPTEMSFSITSSIASCSSWSTVSLLSLFAHQQNLTSLSFWRMLFDILRFNLFSPDLLTVTDEDEQNITLGDYLDREGYSEKFRRDCILPIAIAWNGSPGVRSALRIPAVSLVRFMRNQNMLRGIWGEETTCLTLKGGAKSYIDVLIHGIPKWKIHLSTPVKEVGTREDGKPYLKIIEEEAGECEFQYVYDHIIIATPGDEALRLLGSGATVKEKEILSAFKTTKNKVVLHSDLDHMPALKSTWAAWNYLTTTSARTGGIDKVELTYNLNILHHLRRSAFGDVLATLNPITEPAKKSTQGVYQYHVLVNTQASLAARKRIEMEIQNKRGISFAGAWLGWGSHEDGCASGLKAAERLGVMMPWGDGKVIDSNTVGTPTHPQKMDWIMGLVRMVVWVLSVWVSVVEGLVEGIHDVRKQTGNGGE